VAAFALVAVGLNIVIGYAGLLDLGYVGFYAVGAYTTGVLTVYHWSWPFFLALPVAIVVTMITGVILGAPTLRVRGDYLAIVTLGFGEIIRVIVQNTEAFGRALGLSGIPQSSSVFMVGFWVFLVVLVARRSAGSSHGRSLWAIREDEVAAEAMGIDAFRHKLYAFLLSAVGPGVVGGLAARDQGYIEPISVFPLIMTITMIVMALFGGKGTIWGPVLGASVLFFFQEAVWARFVYLHQLLFGAIIVAVVLLMPRGILGVLQQKYNLPRTI